MAVVKQQLYRARGYGDNLNLIIIRQKNKWKPLYETKYRKYI